MQSRARWRVRLVKRGGVMMMMMGRSDAFHRAKGRPVAVSALRHLQLSHLRQRSRKASDLRSRKKMLRQLHETRVDVEVLSFGTMQLITGREIALLSQPCNVSSDNAGRESAVSLRQLRGPCS